VVFHFDRDFDIHTFFLDLSAGCLKTEFNSAYPTRLHGVISQNEFRESIGNINSKISSRKPQIFCIVIFVLFIVGGLALVIVGATASSTFRTSYSTILFGVGIGAIGCSSIFFTIGYCVIRIRRTNRMRQAIAEESKKYSTRSPIACSWRLNVSRIWTGGYGRYSRIAYIYHVSSTVSSTSNFSKLNEFFFRAVVIRKSIRSKV
jgi:hypothetical protein